MERLVIAAILALVAPAGFADTPIDMATAAAAFLESLPEEQRSRAVFPMDSPVRAQWHFLPPEMFERAGVTLRELDEPRRALVRDLLKTGLSQRGHLAADAIMELEIVVRELGQGRRFRRDELEYFVSVFGTPDARGTWGWRFEGHHLSLHFTVVAGEVTVSTPTFMGTNPAELRDGPKKGQRPLASQEDLARALVESLDATQRAVAVIADTAPADIVTGNSPRVDSLKPAGIAASALRADQQETLKSLIQSYATLMATEIAAVRLARVYETGFENVAFAWAGATEAGQPHYYRVQGPGFMIEYDNTQNDANHAHSVWRDFDGDFGDDLLREHYRTDPAHAQQ